MLSCTIVGHETYLGFLYLEHTYNNPVANTFVALLTDGGDQEDKHSLKGEQSRHQCKVVFLGNNDI
jgi:hypothetical protein